MAATILTHPRFDADAETRERLTERLADLLAHEEILRWHAVPEAEAAYWRLFGDLESGLLPRGDDRTDPAGRRAARRTRAAMRDAETRRSRPPLPQLARREFIEMHRRLVRSLHPQLDPEAAAHGHLWAMAQRACRDGDLVQLRECEAAIRGTGCCVPPEGALRAALADTQARIHRLESGFPLNLRARMRDTAWVANRRAALRRRLPVPETAERRCAARG